MTDVIRKTYFYQDAQAREFATRSPSPQAFNRVANRLFEIAHTTPATASRKAHPLYEPHTHARELVRASDYHPPRSTPAKAYSAPRDPAPRRAAAARSSSCSRSAGLPNHVVGRGIVKRLKTLSRREHPAARLRPRCQLRQYREPLANAHHERERNTSHAKLKAPAPKTRNMA